MKGYKLFFLINILAVGLYYGLHYLQVDIITVLISDALLRLNHTFSTPAAENGFKLFYIKSSFLSNRRSTLLRNVSGKYEILWWNQPGWMIRFKRNDRCKMSSCNYPNCVVSMDRARINQSNAVIMSIFGSKVSDGPPIEKRISGQTWIFFTSESPLSFWADLNSTWRGVFNWSMTYHQDADIFYPNARLIERSPPTKNYSGIFRNKTKQVAWIVSHCKTQALRENYVKILQKYIPVDVYGMCGSEGKRIEEEDRIFSEYKFYLGFENTFCRDYVTEKYFRYMTYDIIDVVRGSFDYNSILPSRTFINAADFKSIEHLGNFLSRLSKNENEYIQYVREKDKYELYGRQQIHCDALCTICEKLNNLPNTRKTYDSVTEWTGQCTSPFDIQ